jgi:N-acetylmuramoyl-L-alanine amidase
MPPDTIWLKAKAKSGDYQQIFLKRYHLAGHQCNFDQFRRLNRINKNSELQKGKTYVLPVQIHDYDGTGIRKSLRISDKDQAERIRAYNDSAKKEGLRADDFRTTYQLWLPWHESTCDKPTDRNKTQASSTTTPDQEEPETKNEETASTAPEVLAATQITNTGNRTFPIFGDQYAYTPLLDTKLRGKVFYVVSGHGGIDSGAQGKRGSKTLCEDEYAYDVALRLTRLLVSHGATAFLIVRDTNDGIRDTDYLDCDTDEVIWGNIPTAPGQRKRLEDRVEVINKFTSSYLAKGITDQTLIEIHVDARGKSAKTDVYFYYRPASVASARVANRLQETFLLRYAKVRATRKYSGTVSERGLFMLTETKTPKAVYIELGNIKNPYDQLRLVMPRNRQLLAQWLLDGIY